MNNIAIVAVGYNRPDSMATLLNSISRVETSSKVDLVISLDKGERQSEIIDVANAFIWCHGEKKVRVFSEKQGLRSHIIQCGDLTNDYDAVVVLEDDLTVSPQFVSYVEQAISFYQDDSRIAGISLYKHLFHPGVARPFEAAHNGYDAYLMQYAQSWGQCWTKQMWKGFKEWYLLHNNVDLSERNLLPDYIAKWNEHSWLKYFMRYIVETDKYFVYPAISLSTNASDVGQHCVVSTSDYQVPLLCGKMEFRFPKVEEAIVYDIFFERMGIDADVFTELQGKKKLDLYGCRTDYSDADYIISTRKLPCKLISTIALSRRPVEENVILPMNGEGIYIYEAKESTITPQSNHNFLTRYDVRGVHWKRMLKLSVFEAMDAIKSRIK